MKQHGEFKIGDVVVLKSGGPSMTIVSIDYLYGDSDQVYVWCSWFKSENETAQQHFPVEAIKPSQES